MNIEQENIEMRSAFHKKGIKGNRIIFCVLDTGINENHKELTYSEKNIAMSKVIDAPFGRDDEHGHGTFVSGQLCSNSFGWCPDARLINYKVLFNEKVGGGHALVMKALDDILKRARLDSEHKYIVNMSLSGEYGSSESKTVMDYQNAIDALVDMGVSVFVSAGNDGSEAMSKYPSCFQSPFCVSALDANGERAWFSTYHGEVDFGEHGVNVQGICGINGSNRTFTGYTASGTSMSCPNLAGKAGLLQSEAFQNRGSWLTEDELFEKLKALAFDINKEGFDPFTGWGYVRLKETEYKEEKPMNRLERFISFLKEQLGQPYVLGAHGQMLTESQIRKMDAQGERAIAFIKKHFADKPFRCFDCSGLISKFFEDEGTVSSKLNCNHLANMCTVQVRKGGENLKIGDLVFRWNGLKPYYHVGIHIGNNQIIESKGRDDGVVQRDINASGSTYWNRIGTGLFEEKTEQRDLFLSKPMMRGEDVKALQVKLNELGYSCGEADGVYGKNTDGAVKAYLKDVQEAATQTDIVTPIVKKIMGVKT